MVYKKISLHEKIFRMLEKLREEKGFGSISDTIAYLVNYYVDTRELIKEIREIICSTARISYATMSSTAYSSHATMEETEIVKRKRKGKSMREIIKELKVQLLSEIKPRNPDAFIRKAKEEGIMVIKGNRDVAIVDPEFYDEFMSRLKYFPDLNNIGEIELSNEEKKFFNFLRVNGLIYFDSKEQKWISVV